MGARKASLKEKPCQTSGILQPYRVASSLQALLGLQQGPFHGWGGHGIVVCLIIPHTQGLGASVDLETKYRSQIRTREGGPRQGSQRSEKLLSLTQM